MATEEIKKYLTQHLSIKLTKDWDYDGQQTVTAQLLLEGQKISEDIIWLDHNDS